MSLLLLSHVVLVAFVAEAALGFGATVLAVTLGVHLYPLDQLLPALVPVNMLVSGVILLRHPDAVDGRLLLRRIVPFMALGLPAGLLVFRWGSGELLKGIFACFVIVLASLELARTLRAREASARPLPFAGGAALLVAGGFIHGVYGSGGPMVVFVASRELADKRRFRSTLAALWLALNCVLLASFAAGGKLTAETASMSGVLVAPVVLALLAGEWLHARLAGRAFRVGVAALLLLAGGALLSSVLR